MEALRLSLYFGHAIVTAVSNLSELSSLLGIESRSFALSVPFQPHVIAQCFTVSAVNGLDRNFDDAEVDSIKEGLQNVRDQVISLLDQIDARTKLQVQRRDPSQGMPFTTTLRRYVARNVCQ